MRGWEGDELVSGAEGTATAVIDGNVVELMELREITATLTINKTDVRVLGSRMTKQKATGAAGTGSMTIYYIRSLFGKMLLQYIKTGKLPKFDINITNQDPGSSTGRQVTKLSGVSLNSYDIAKLNLDGEPLDESVDFTFEDADYLNEFNQI